MPTTIQVYADTVGPGRCRGAVCGALITWAEIVATGKKMCFDGELVALATSREPATGRTIWAVDLDTNHWATCPNSPDFKRRAAR